MPTSPLRQREGQVVQCTMTPFKMFVQERSHLFIVETMEAQVS